MTNIAYLLFNSRLFIGRTDMGGASRTAVHGSEPSYFFCTWFIGRPSEGITFSNHSKVSKWERSLFSTMSTYKSEVDLTSSV